tara:strand:- start:674 stop:955 length:282 start_codon:yes stop_codon:yes gene_type:complete
MAQPVYRQIVVEYDEVMEYDKTWGKRKLVPVKNRIISWRKETEDSSLAWKEIKCPQQTFHGIKGYYNTLGVPVIFYNRNRNQMEKSLPTSVNL